MKALKYRIQAETVSLIKLLAATTFLAVIFLFPAWGYLGIIASIDFNFSVAPRIGLFLYSHKTGIMAGFHLVLILGFAGMLFDTPRSQSREKILNVCTGLAMLLGTLCFSGLFIGLSQTSPMKGWELIWFILWQAVRL